MKTKQHLKPLVFATAVFTGLSALAAEAGKPVIATTNYPLTYFTERLAGDHVDILYQVPEGIDPAFWKPTDAQVEKIQKADLIMMNEATYEKWAVTAAMPLERMVDTSLGFADKFIETADATVHSHGAQGLHSHGGTAFTTWLDFGQAAQQATAVAEALVAELPARAAEVEGELERLKEDLAGLDEAMKSATEPWRGKTVLASHPVYQYWSRAYGVEVAALLWEPEMELDEDALSELDKKMKENPGTEYFIWEGNPAESHVSKLKAKGLTSIVLDPCGARPDEGDFLGVMKANVANIRAATGGK